MHYLNVSNYTLHMFLGLLVWKQADYSSSNDRTRVMHVNSNTGSSEPDNFMEIWAHNLEEGFEKIRRIVQNYPYVAMVSSL